MKLLILSLSECLQCAKQLDTIKVAKKVATTDQTRETQGIDICDYYLAALQLTYVNNKNEKG